MKIYKGKAGAPGIAAAKVLYYGAKAGGGEKLGIDDAVAKALERVGALKQKAHSQLGGDKAKIFDAYEMLLADPMLLNPIKAAIENGAEIAAAIESTCGQMAEKLSKMKNEYMRQRADDIRHVGSILTDAANGTDADFTFPDGEEKYIIAAYELTPVDTMLFDRERLAGLITETGGATSHTVILAKSMGIPSVVGAENLSDADGRYAYLNGYDGTLTCEPNDVEEQRLKKLLGDERELAQSLDKIKSADAYTADGERIAVLVNIGKPSDLKNTDGVKFDGVGLFRSEFLYQSSDKKPTEAEQIAAYKEVIEKVYPNPVTVRTLDVGGDKELKYLGMKKEENPFLGNRGIRLCLANPDIFSEQIRSLLIAGKGKSLKIMLPMVTSVSEIDKTRTVIDGVKKILDESGTAYCTDIKLGIMIETPAAAIMAEKFAKHCGFFSIGTNDLVQYITAADRGNSDVENVYDPCNPAVMSMIAHTISAADDAGIDVSLCGDLAANTFFTQVLIGMGLKKFSVPHPLVGRVKHKIQKCSTHSAKQLAKKVIAAETADEVRKLLSEGEV